VSITVMSHVDASSAARSDAQHLAALYNPFLPVPLRRRARRESAAREQQRQRRSHILAAVRRLLTEVGCEKVTVRDIADESGYAVQTIYNLVGPRDQAISEAISEYSIFVGRTAGQALTTPDALHAIVDRWLHAISVSPEFCRQTSLIYFSDSRSIYYRHRDTQVQGLYHLLKRQQMSGIIKRDVDVRLLAEQLGFFASGMWLEWADRPFALSQLYRKLCAGYASMLADKLTTEHASVLNDWKRRSNAAEEVALRWTGCRL
jgi:AcrR family transcriptional regulator